MSRPSARHHLWIHFVVGILKAYFKSNHSFRAEGLENIPKHGPLIVIINHVSFLEPFALGIALVDGGLMPGENTWTVAKKELMELPLLSRFFSSVGFFPIDREHIDMDAMRTILNTLKQGDIIAMAPEGTRSRSGQLQLMQPVVAKIAISRHVPILPAAAIGAEKAMPVGAKFPKHVPITIRFGPVFELDEFYSGRLDEERLKEAAWAMRNHIAELLPEGMRELPAADSARKFTVGAKHLP